MENFYTLLFIVALVGLVVFVALYFIDAGYGKMLTNKWGPTLPNKIGWSIMEAPVFFLLLWFWINSKARFELPYLVFFLIFEFHYFQRSFVFPFLMKGNGRMPIIIMLFSVIWNLVNGYIQGVFFFELAPQYMADMYTADWLLTPQFIVGTLIFAVGMIINLHSDHVIRHLRKQGDTKHYFPKKGMYRYVTSANYLGEILEWLGWAVLTWSFAGLIFFWFTCCNLVPRANSIWHKYEREFPDEFAAAKPKRIFPFIY